MEAFWTMTRKQLQALCKKHGVPANLKNAEMAARLSSLIKAQEEVRSGSGEFENVKVGGKKKVRFSPENDVYEFVDTYMVGVEEEQAEARRYRASRRGLRKSGLAKADNVTAVETAICESEETFSDQVRLTRSRKSVVIVSPPLGKRGKTGGDETFEAGEDKTVGRIFRLSEANSLDSEPAVETKSAAEVPRRTRTQRKFKGHDTSIMRSDYAIRPVVEQDLLTGHRGSVHDLAPLRKSSRVAMKNLTNLPENQNRESAGVLKKQEKMRLKIEFTTVIPDNNESITLAREEEENVSQVEEDHTLVKSLRRSELSSSTSTTATRLDVASSRENQRTCGTLEVELPIVKPLRMSRRKNYGYDAPGLSGVNSLPSISTRISPSLKKTRTNETECCHEAITNNVTCNCTESDLLVDRGCLSKKLDCEKRLHKRRKRSAISGKGVSKSVKSYPGENNILNKADVSELKDINSDGFLSITEVVKDGILSAKTLTLSGSKMHDEFVEASVLTCATQLVKESTICTAAAASVMNLANSMSVLAVEKSQISTCDSDVLQRETVTADPVQRGLEFEEPENLSEFTNSFSCNKHIPHAGCTGFEMSVEVQEKPAVFGKKHDNDSSVSSDTRINKCVPTEGIPDQIANIVEEAAIVLYKSPAEGKEAYEITTDWPIAKEEVSKEDSCGNMWSNMPTKQNAVDGEYEEISSGVADQSIEAGVAYLNDKSISCCRSDKDKATRDQDITKTNEWQLNLYTLGSEVVKNLSGEMFRDEMASDDRSFATKQDDVSFEGNSDGYCSLDFVRTTPEHGITCTGFYHDKRSNKSVSNDQTDALKLDGRPNIRTKLDPKAEVSTVDQFIEALKPQLPVEVNSTLDIIAKMEPGTSEIEVLSTEAGTVSLCNSGPNKFESREADAELCSQKGSLSHIVGTDINATNHLAAETSQELDKKTNDSLLYFTRVNKISGDAGSQLPSVTKNEFAQDGHAECIDEVCTTLNVTNLTVDHSVIFALNDAGLVSSESSPSFYESQAERDAEITDIVDYSTVSHIFLSNEGFTAGKGTQNPNAAGCLNGVSQNLSKEFASEYMERNRLALYSGTSQSEEVTASHSLKALSRNLPNLSFELEEFSCTDTLNKPPCPEDPLADKAIVSSEEAIGVSNIDEYSEGKREAELNSSIGSRVNQSIAEVMNEVEDNYTITELGDRPPYFAPYDLDNAEESSMDFVNCHETKLLSTDREAVFNLENKARTEIGDLTSFDPDACGEYSFKNCTDNKEIIISKEAHVTRNDVGMARESASCAEFPSFDKLDGLLQEIDDYFEWRNSEREVLAESALSDVTKANVLNSNVDTHFEEAIKTDYGRNVHMNEDKCIAGVDVEVAVPWEGHSEQIDEIADHEHVDEFIIKDDHVDCLEDTLEAKCPEEHGLFGYESVRTSVISLDAIQSSPYQSVICTGLKVTCPTKRTLEIDSHQCMTAGFENVQFEHFADDRVENRLSTEENTELSQGVVDATSGVRFNDSLGFNNSSCQIVSNEATNGNSQMHETDTYFLDTTAKSGQAVHFMPVSPHESTTGLLSDIGVLYSDEQNPTIKLVNYEHNCEGSIGELNLRTLSSCSNSEAEIFAPCHGLVAHDILGQPYSEKNNQEPTSLETNYTLDISSSNKVGDTATIQQKVPKVMKENVTPFSKTEPLKCPKSAGTKRRRVLDNLQNN